MITLKGAMVAVLGAASSACYLVSNA